MYIYISANENDTRKILCDVDIQMDHLTPARRSDPVLVNKEKKRVLLSSQRTTEWKSKIDRYLDLARVQRNLENTMVTVIPV